MVYFVMQLIECPSVYELMASSHFEWSEPPELRLWRKQTEENGDKVEMECFGPKDNLHVMMAALKNNKVLSKIVFSYHVLGVVIFLDVLSFELS
jgi:hypothetical protein